MAKNKIRELLIVVDKEIKKAQRRFDEVKIASDTMQKTAAASWSSAGDREYAIGQLQINKYHLDALKRLKKELGDSGQQRLEEIAAPCYIEIKGIDSKKIFLVKNVATISGSQLVSVESPLGKKLIGKSVGDAVVVNEKKFEIKKIS